MQIGPDWGQPVRLRQVLPEAELIGADDVSVASCSHDSRRIEPGDLFVALSGSVHDGHLFAGEAASRGCSAVLSQRRMPRLDVPVCLVPDVRSAYGRLCQALAGDPSRQMKVVGITGTNGKTTTSFLVAGILATAGYPTGIIGTLGNFDGDDWQKSPLTTPSPDKLAAAMARMVRNGCTHAVMEVSSHGLDQGRLAGVSLAAACVTNVRRDHLDYHHTLRDYRLTKSRLLDYLGGEGFAVINADDPTSAGYLPTIQSPALTVAMRSQAEITGTLIERYTSEQTFLLSAGSETMPVRTRMIGAHHVYNCLVAAAVGLAFGIDLATVVRGLETVESVPGRLERIECGQPFSVFVDYAHTPDALEGVLDALREVVAGRLICVFGAGGDRDREKRPLMARAVETGADLAVVTTDNPRSEDPQAIQDEVMSGFFNPDAARAIADRYEAIGWALSEARPGDCVLVAGKGHEDYQIIGDVRSDFDDRQVARDWLYRLGAEATSLDEIP
jgi:UDP-N-acetylmuramoyl-L-alanyl-D-glutamate--2,6-diaminopimelate ligase